MRRMPLRSLRPSRLPSVLRKFFSNYLLSNMILSLTLNPSQAKAQPKPATATKPAAGARRGRGRPRKGRTVGNRKKTVEELDAEMVDYFAANNENAVTTDGNAAANGTAQQPATNGEDLEISVSLRSS